MHHAMEYYSIYHVYITIYDIICDIIECALNMYLLKKHSIEEVFFQCDQPATFKAQSVPFFMLHCWNQDHEKVALRDVGGNG